MTFHEYIAVMNQKGVMPTVANYFETVEFLNRHELLHKFMLIGYHVRSQLKNDYMLTRLSRIDDGEFIFPTEDDDLMAEDYIWFDTSGSIHQDQWELIQSEIKGIMQTIGESKPRVGYLGRKIR